MSLVSDDLNNPKVELKSQKGSSIFTKSEFESPRFSVGSSPVFSKSKFPSQKFQKKSLLELLEIPPEERSKEDIKIMIHYFGAYQYFQNFDQEKKRFKMLARFCQKVRLQKYQKNDIVFHFGDPSDKFYIVIKGVLQVFIPKKSELLEGEIKKASKETYRRNKMNKYTFGGINFRVHLRNQKLFEQKSKIFLFNQVSTLDAEKVFGEVGISSGETRSAMIASSTDNTAVAYLDITDYVSILKEIDSKKLIMRQNFLNKHLIKNLEYNELKKICLFYKSIELKYGSYVFKEGQPLQNIYMVVRGEISVRKFEGEEDLPKKDDKVEEIKKSFFQNLRKKKDAYHPIIFKVSKGGHLAIDSAFSSVIYEYTAKVSSSSAELYFLRIKNVHRLNLDYPTFGSVLKSIASKLKASRAVKYFKIKETIKQNKNILKATEEKIKKIKSKKNAFFTNLNAIDSRLNKKRENLYRLINEDTKMKKVCNPTRYINEQDTKEYQEYTNEIKTKYGLPKLFLKCDFEKPSVKQKAYSLKLLNRRKWYKMQRFNPKITINNQLKTLSRKLKKNSRNKSLGGSDILITALDNRRFNSFNGHQYSFANNDQVPKKEKKFSEFMTDEDCQKVIRDVLMYRRRNIGGRRGFLLGSEKGSGTSKKVGRHGRKSKSSLASMFKGKFRSRSDSNRIREDISVSSGVTSQAQYLKTFDNGFTLKSNN